MPAAQRSLKAKKTKCYYCGKPGHIKRNCCIRIAEERKAKTGRVEPNPKVNKAVLRGSSVSEDNGDALVASHALAANATNTDWIIDSGATCHMCNDEY